MGGTRFMVQWEEHPSHLATRLGQLLEHQTLVDVTLMCNTHTLRVHRAVLAACSPYFETILQRQLGMYPLIVLKDMQFSVLKSLIEFMYCGETSVTEDNLSALLQAAKFFQVKGLSAMTKEALGLTSPATPKTTTTVNGEAARKAFVGRSKRVGMQQTFVASGLKSVTPSSSHIHGPGGDVHAPTTAKTIFQTTPKSVPVRQDTHQQQQQTDTAQLLLSLSGSEFPKQTFHTVSKNVRFHHGASSGNVTVEPSRTCSLESSIVKNKEPPCRSEVIDRVPVVTPDGVKSTSVILPAPLAEKGLEQQIIPEKVVEGTKDDVTSQMFYVEDGPCKRGRPLKRQMNLVFQEKVLTDAEMALQKEAEASRKALEMLQQEMSTGDETPNTVVTTHPAENVQQKLVPVKQAVTKAQPLQPVNNMITTSRILPKEPTVTSKLNNQKTNIITQVTAVNTPETSTQNVIYQVAGNTIPAIDSSSNETNIVYHLQEGQDSGNANIVYQVADNAVLAGQDSNNQNIIYQVADSASTSTEGNNTNIIYQVTDSSNSGSGTTMSQYMEVLKEAGLPSDVPILLESSDGSYVSVNEEVLMNIMNGGMIQVADGSIVGGEGVQFIVQEVQEVNEGQIENAPVSVEQGDTSTPDVATSATGSNDTVTETISAPSQGMQNSEAGSTVQPKPPVAVGGLSTVKHATYKPAKGQQIKSTAAKSLPSLEVKETTNVTPGKSSVASFHECPTKDEKGEVSISENMQIKINKPESEPEPEPQPIPEPPTQSDEIITGDNYGEEAMEGFAVIEAKDNPQNRKMTLIQQDTPDFVNPEQSNSNETNEKPFPPNRDTIKESKTETTPASGNMSVEQALQAMMGEGSDTEMEVCANTDADGTTKVKPVILHRDTKGRSTPNEGSIDEETEDLRLVLSPEDDSVKVEDESQSAGEGSLNDSFTLALSSPDSTGNEKSHLETDNVTESAEESQQLETKSSGSVIESTDLKEANTVETVDEAGTKYPTEAILTCESNSTAATSCNEISESVSGEISNDSSSLDVRAGGSVKETSAVALEQSDSDTVLKTIEPESSLISTDDIHSENVHCAETDDLLVDTSSANVVRTDHKNIADEKLPDTEGSVDPVVTDNLDVESNTKHVLPESGVTEPIGFQADTICSDNDTNNTKSLPDVETHESNIIAENIADVSKTTSNIPLEEELKTEVGNNSISELPHDELPEIITDTSSSLSDVVTNENKEESLTRELKDFNSDEVSILNDSETKKCVENEETRTIEESDVAQVENQGNEQLEIDNASTDEKDVSVEGGTVISPSKDIPYAVGLLPLKTALEKLQAMPEYHPRKTRSASSSKESTNEIPASRLKRKSSSTTEGLEKKLKPDDGDCSSENENNIPLATEELEESCEENVTSESSLIEATGDKMAIESTVPEEHMETGEVENKVEPLPSMMELVSDSSEMV